MNRLCDKIFNMRLTTCQIIQYKILNKMASSEKHALIEIYNSVGILCGFEGDLKKLYNNYLKFKKKYFQ